MKPSSATLRVFLDVIVEPNGNGQWIAISREAGSFGETLMLEVVVDVEDESEIRERLPVCVVDSRPVMVDGNLRHRIRLHGGDLAPVLFEQQVRRG